MSSRILSNSGERDEDRRGNRRDITRLQNADPFDANSARWPYSTLPSGYKRSPSKATSYANPMIYVDQKAVPIHSIKT
eukprot:CAMPEP_0172542842 /NCGR_PEP_ID=MMETSP1067-20121228/13370_1 /TAXON_ID=265564 ORGANISM="Thalassiosira punctigera, Strain Tpunct2005C2" /NCGR_SAMPLE_ID=MMETSP1067 /ASSEMBLY_ACC=CAM_ASM_000444 /LENGTH=77 /DNA_ID=CAMNT_0013329145 /DNA_START=458 /DNA_END=691 /DNA_ORIENTATION=+